MKVLIVNTSYSTGGAAVAARRLMDALNQNGVEASMLVRDGRAGVSSANVTVLPHRWLTQWHFLWDRLVLYVRLHFSWKNLFAIDAGISGTDITRQKVFREADVIHLHWVNQGMLSLSDIRKILRSGKAVVWTMHDLWPATSLCHYARHCRRFTTRCRQCPLLPGGGSSDDYSSRVWRRKERVLAEGSVFFVTCSRWLEGEAKSSALLRHHQVTNIPNAIDTRIYRPLPLAEARAQAGLPATGRVILFVSQRVTDGRKGMTFFIEALHELVRRQPGLAEDTTVAILGGHADEVASQLPLKAHALGYVSDERTIVAIYASATLFVTPSLEDNLPNTIMEALACGVPCVGFRVGGIPEMIGHKKNGYLAEPRNATQLADGMEWVLCQADAETLRRGALSKVEHSYSQRSVSMRYREIYQQALAQKHFKL